MSVNTYSLKQRIKELTNENNELRRKRAELEEKVAAKSRQEEEILASRSKPRASPSRPSGTEIIFQNDSDDGCDEKELESSSSVLKCIALNEQMTSGLQFSNEQREILGDWDKYEADASVGSVFFHVKFNWNDLLLKANSIDIQLDDPFHKLELSSWLGSCIRKNNLQKALQSIVEYSKRFNEREEMLRQIHSEHESNFVPEKSTVKKAYVFDIVDSDIKYLQGSWFIKWNPAKGSMCHSVALDVSKTPQGKALALQHKYIIKELNSPELSLGDINKCLRQLVEGLQKRTDDST